MSSKPLFELGQIVTTPGALDALETSGVNPLDLIKRHVSGDWGEVPPEDAQENDFSVKEGYRILSAYTVGDGVKIWIITEADRSATTFLLPDDY